MNLQTSHDLNNGGNATEILIYQLNNDANFRLSTAETFWLNDEETLGAELIKKEQSLTLHPGTSQRLDIPIVEGAKFIGLAANLFSPDGDRWRQIQPVRGKKLSLVIEVGRDYLEVNTSR